MARKEESRLLRCLQCGELWPGSATTDGTLIPTGAARGGRCHECDGDEFEQVMFTPSD